MNNHNRRLVNTVLGGLLVLGIGGAWGFAATRASTGDVEAVDAKVEKVDEQQRALAEQLNTHLIEQARFRGETETQLKAILDAVNDE